MPKYPKLKSRTIKYDSPSGYVHIGKYIPPFEKVKNGFGLFELSPITSKTHQLRVHMQSLGMPILHDRFYPVLQPKGPDNFDKPLQLLAKRLRFTDPISAIEQDFQCQSLNF